MFVHNNVYFIYHLLSALIRLFIKILNCYTVGTEHQAPSNAAPNPFTLKLATGTTRMNATTPGATPPKPAPNTPAKKPERPSTTHPIPTLLVELTLKDAVGGDVASFKRREFAILGN